MLRNSYLDSDAAADLVADIVRDGDVVLVKGSRGVKTEKIVAELLDKFDLEDKQAANHG